jgi:hypothetical protein
MRSSAKTPKLIAGPYRTPTCRPGGRFACVVNGDRQIMGITDALIPWPYAFAQARVRQLFVSGDLERAIRTESRMAVAHHWGVSTAQVESWRRALGVPRMNQGTTRLWRELADSRLGEAGRRRGGKNHATRLTEAQVAELRRNAKHGLGPVALAKEFGITRQYASAIITGKARPRP